MPALRSNGTARSITFISALLASTAFTVPAFAQIETVIVTAEKKAEDIQTVPIAVTAISSEDLKKKEITTFKDLQFNVPNLTFAKTGLGSGTVSIRGIGQAAGDPGVAIYQNGVYSEGTDLATGQYFDLDAVEVLRGPQGTLYGRGSIGGAININSAKPDLENFLTSADFTYGTFNTINSNAMINIPFLNDTMALRVAGQFSSHDGFTKNIGAGGDYNSLNDYSVRGSLRWQPNAHSTIDVIATYFDEADGRTRGDNTLCERDPSGVLGCLPDGLALQPINSYASTNGLGGSKQFFASIGALTGGGFIAPAIYGHAATVGAVVGGLQFLGGLTAGQAAVAANPATPFATFQGLIGLGYAQVDAKGGLFDVSVANGPGSGASTAAAIPQDIRTINSSVKPVFDENSLNMSVHWHENISDELSADVILGHREGTRRTTSSYSDQPDENIQSAIVAAVPNLLNSFALYSGDTPARVAALSAAYFSHGSVAGGNLQIPWSNTIPGGIVNTTTGIHNFSNFVQVQDDESAHGHENSGEFRLSSSFDGWFNFTAGAFYWERASPTADYRVAFNGGDYASIFLGQTVGSFNTSGGNPPRVGLDPMYYQNAASRATSTAAFADATMSLIPDLLTLKAGLRWSEDKDTLGPNQSSFISLNGGSTASTCVITSFCYGAVSSDPAAVRAQALATYHPAPATSKDTSLVDYRAVLEYKPKLSFTDQTFIYASYSRGSKPGNLNLVPATAPVGAIPLVFAPERLSAYEIGAKNTLLDGTLQANLTAWYYDYQNFQYTAVAYSTLFTQNISARMWGEEAEFIWQPDSHWMFGLQATNSDSTIGNSFLVDGRNPTYGNANAILIKSTGLTAGGDLPGQSCVLITSTGMSPAEDPAVTAAYGGINPFAAPAGAGTLHQRTTQLSSHGVAYVNYGVCAGATNSPVLNPLGYHYASAADGAGSSPSGIARSLKGNSVPRLPPNTVNVSAQYIYNMNGGYTLVPRLDYYWQSGYNSRVFNDAVDDVGSWDSLNASLQLNSGDGHWYAKVYATNVMDSDNTQAKALASDTSGNYTTVFLEDPRVIGFTLGANW